jgi:thioredoxin-dependent peroxiredoxin
VEGQALRDSAERFTELGAVILGASFDTVADNLAFAEAQQFPFRLLSDVDRRVGTAYEVVRPADDQYAAFPRRYSYLIGPDGTIHRAYDVTDVAAHAGDVLADIERAAHDTR